jgi:hypothetical protein
MHKFTLQKNKMTTVEWTQDMYKIMICADFQSITWLMLTLWEHKTQEYLDPTQTLPSWLNPATEAKEMKALKHLES